MNLELANQALWTRYWNREIDFTELLMHLRNIDFYIMKSLEEKREA